MEEVAPGDEARTDDATDGTSNRAQLLRWSPVVVPWLWYIFRGVHPILDFVAIALPVLVVGFFIIGAVRALRKKSPAAAAFSVSIAVFFLLTVISPWRPVERAEPVEPFTIASMNVGAYWFSDNDAGYFAFRREPDILVGTELSESHDTEFLSRFDHTVSDIISLRRQQENEQNAAARGTGYGRYGFPSIGVYSIYEMEELSDPIADEVDGGLPGFRIRVSTPGGPIVLYALHIPRPGRGTGVYEVSAQQQIQMIDAISEAIKAETQPVVLIGDLNAVDRGIGYRTLADGMVDGMRVDNWAVPTSDRGLPYSLLLARIDHLLVSNDLCTQNVGAEDTRFSDHRPIYADVGRCP